MKRILITGGNGFIAGNVIDQLHKDHHLFATVRKREYVDDLIHFEEIDLRDEKEMRYFIKDVKPDFIIHSAAISSDAQCEADLPFARFVNVESTQYLREVADSIAAHFIFLSTDLIFYGDKPPYMEEMEVKPKMTYGRLKAEAESKIDTNSRNLILRIPLMYGLGKYNRKGLLNGMVECMKSGDSLNLFHDEYRTPLYVNDFIVALRLCIENELAGTYHIAGCERLSRYEFGLKVAQAFDLSGELCLKKSQADLGLDKKRPADVSLNMDKIKALGFEPKTIDENLRHLISQSNLQ